MKLSIIIPNFNSENTILKTLDSIYSQNLKDFEVIVIDNASTYNSLDLISKYPLKIIKLKKNYGASKARNKGISNASGKYLVFIDSDAWFSKNSLKKLVQKLKKVDIVFPKIIFENKDIFYPNNSIEKKYPHISACFGVKKNSLEKLDELFDEFYETYLEDYDFFMRCNLVKLKAKYIKSSIIIHKNKTSVADYSNRYYLEVRNTLYGIKKLGNLPKKTILYNPFKYSDLTKIVLYGFFNFAWFNWQNNNRLNFYKKIKTILFKKNTISKNSFFLKQTKAAFLNIKNNKIKINLKKKKIIFFYSQ